MQTAPPLSREGTRGNVIEVNRLKYQQEGDPLEKLLPPTSLSPPTLEPNMSS